MNRKSIVQLVVTAAILSLFAASPAGSEGTASTKATHVPVANVLRCEVTGVAPLATSNAVGNFTYDGWCVSENVATRKCGRYYDHYGCPTGSQTHRATLLCGYWVDPDRGCDTR